MLNTDEANGLAKWIQNWKKTYKENPKLNECITWFEWKYKDRELISNEKDSIATILKFTQKTNYLLNSGSFRGKYPHIFLPKSTSLH